MKIALNVHVIFQQNYYNTTFCIFFFFLSS